MQPGGLSNGGTGSFTADVGAVDGRVGWSRCRRCGRDVIGGRGTVTERKREGKSAGASREHGTAGGGRTGRGAAYGNGRKPRAMCVSLEAKVILICNLSRKIGDDVDDNMLI